MSAVANKLSAAIQLLLDNTGHPPKANCSCHLSPPCNDCTDWGGLREAISDANEALDQHAKAQHDRHPDDVAVDAFAVAMKLKLAEARAKGRGGWHDPAQCTDEDLSRMLRDHLAKGDPRDVANFCMMLYQRGEAIVAESKPAAAQEAVEDASNIIELLLTLAYAAWSLADNADGGSGNDNVSVDRRDFDKVSEALDALDELPDDQPGYVMEAAAKARWALRGILAAPVAAAPVDPNGLILDLRAAVSIGRPLLHSDVDEIERALASAPAAPGIDLSKLQRYRVASDTNDVRNLYKDDTGTWVKIQDVERALIDASPKGGSTDAEPKIWGTQKPGSMPKLFGAHHIAQLNWYPDEGHDLVCMQVIERVQATSAEVGA